MRNLIRSLLMAGIASPNMMPMRAGEEDNRAMPDLLRNVSRILFYGDSLTDGSKVALILPSHFADAGMDTRFALYPRIIREVAEEAGGTAIDAHALFRQWEEAGREVLGDDGISHYMLFLGIRPVDP